MVRARAMVRLRVSTARLPGDRLLDLREHLERDGHLAHLVRVRPWVRVALRVRVRVRVSDLQEAR